MLNAEGYSPLELVQHSTIAVQSDLKTIPTVLDWFSQFHQPIIPEEVWLQCQLALVEGFTNAVRHGNRNLPPETLIEVNVHHHHHQMQIRIWDWGPGFDLEEKLRNASQRISQDSSGGRGLLLMARIANELSYTRTADGRNCLLLVKQY